MLDSMWSQSGTTDTFVVSNEISGEELRQANGKHGLLTVTARFDRNMNVLDSGYFALDVSDTAVWFLAAGDTYGVLSSGYVLRTPLEVGRSWDYLMPKTNKYYGVVSLTDTLALPHGTVANCVTVFGKAGNSSGCAYGFDTSWYAWNIGKVRQVLYTRTSPDSSTVCTYSRSTYELLDP